MEYEDPTIFEPDESLDEPQTLDALSQAYPYLRNCPLRLRSKLLQPTAARFRKSPQGFYLQIGKRLARSVNRKERSPFGHFDIVSERKTAEGTLRLAKPFSIETTLSAVEKHREKAASELLKDSKKRKVSRVAVGGTTYIVKEFSRPGPWGRLSADARSWRMGLRLAQYGIPCCQYHAWLKARDGKGYIVLSDVGPHGMHAFLSRCDSRRRLAILKAAGRLLGSLHNMGIVHKDLKVGNFVVDPESLDVWLIDLDAIVFATTIRKDTMRKVFKQFFTQLPSTVTHYEYLNALTVYVQESGASHRDVLQTAEELGIGKVGA